METKTRRLLAALALVVVGLFSVTGVAGAQEEGEPTDEEHGDFVNHEAEECVHILEDGGTVEQCQEAPNPILPATDELFWSIVSFTVLSLVLWKFAWPALRNGMEARSERIRQSIEDAERAKSEGERVLSEYQSQLADARNEAARIIEEARQTADQLRRDLTARAEAEAVELRQRNAEQIAAERDRVMAELQGQVASLAVELAERVVEANLDRDANMRLIENYINSVGSGARS